MNYVRRILAIKGDSKNGKEIIRLLGLLGGNNIHEYDGTDTNVYYFINDVWNYTIDTYRNDSPKQLEDHLAFYTLDGFNARFPYKIGEKVDIIKGGTSCVCCEILNMQWNEEYNGIMYYVQDANKKYWWVKADDIRYAKYSNLRYNLDDNVNMNIEFDLSKYSYEVKDGKLIIEEKKPEYPKTYEECCQHLGCDDKISSKKLVLFSQLINAKNAYWKIAGEEMGLGKPWEPNWKRGEQKKYCIYYGAGIIQKGACYNYNSILSFPTEEMRDAFYENFKNLIVQCKELL